MSKYARTFQYGSADRSDRPSPRPDSETSVAVADESGEQPSGAADSSSLDSSSSVDSPDPQRQDDGVTAESVDEGDAPAVAEGEDVESPPDVTATDEAPADPTDAAPAETAEAELDADPTADAEAASDAELAADGEPVQSPAAAVLGESVVDAAPEEVTDTAIDASAEEPLPAAEAPAAVEPAVPAAEAPVVWRGETTIADEVVEKVAGIAARKVEGVYDLGGDASRLFSTVRERIGLGEGSDGRGISVKLTGRAAQIAVTLVVAYGHPVYGVADQVRQDVGDAVQRMLGIEVTEVNIVVDDVHVPDA